MTIVVLHRCFFSESIGGYCDVNIILSIFPQSKPHDEVVERTGGEFIIETLSDDSDLLYDLKARHTPLIMARG